MQLINERRNARPRKGLGDSVRGMENYVAVQPQFFHFL